MPIEDIRIETEEIQLDQFLKWAGVLASGGELKMLIENRQIKRNGETASARRRKLDGGDTNASERPGERREVKK